jgi:hypothetical protein
LERGLLAAFLDKFKKLPCYNKQGKRYRLEDVDAYFTQNRLKAIIDDLS